MMIERSYKNIPSYKNFYVRKKIFYDRLTMQKKSAQSKTKVIIAGIMSLSIIILYH